VSNSEARETQTIDFHALPTSEVLKTLDTQAQGLSEAAAASRYRHFGPNAIDSMPLTPWYHIILRQFRSPLIAILLIAALVTAVLQEWVDFGAIAIVLALNASIGFWQELRAESEVRALASMSVPITKVRRDSKEQKLIATALVPGDIVLLESGDRVPADLRFLDVNGLQVDESMLTGETTAVSKQAAEVSVEAVVADRLSMGFSGTFVTSGRAVAVVVATGNETELGAINAMIQIASGKTPLQLAMGKLEKGIGGVVAVAAAAVFIGGWLLGESVGQIFLAAVALAVASIPEALPIVLTIALSIGVRRMAEVNAIVRTLPAVETLGSTSVIATDKTGTLTVNRLTVEETWGPDLETLLRGGASTNEAFESSEHPGELMGDSVDVAMANAAIAAGVVSIAMLGQGPLAQLPYEPALRLSMAVRPHPVDDTKQVLWVKGAPDSVLGMCTGLGGLASVHPLDPDEVNQAHSKFTEAGLRVIAVAFRVFESSETPAALLGQSNSMVFAGMQAMVDPPREGVADAVAQCRKAGIRVVMITGDHPKTAAVIGGRLGLDAGGDALTGAELAGLDDAQVLLRLEQTSIAARVSPADKLRIVRVLQSADNIVAVTGDGVNDAPALKSASIGVAMGRSGTDVAREASDIVLTDDNFVTIVQAVKQGRVTFAAIRKATFFLVSTGLAIMLAVTVSVFAAVPLLFLPVQVLWINMVTNGLQDVALAFEPAEGGELERKPRPTSEGVISRVQWYRILLTGFWMAAGMLTTFSWALNAGYDLDHARTLALTLFVLFSFFQSGSSRAEFRSLFQLNPLGNPFLAIAAVGALALHWGAMNYSVTANLLGFVPLSLQEWLILGAAASSVLIIIEADKLMRRFALNRYSKPSASSSM
jgi:P-type Ca2+ transporter type 2C